MGLFVAGIPLVQFLALCRNKKYFDADKCTSDEDYRKYLLMTEKYGSIFEAYTPECYYYDLIDLMRRLILTGGLILVGQDQAVAQIFLGILVNSMWLCLVLYSKPYLSSWDTLLSASLSFVLTITLVSGVCVRLYSLTDLNDEYQKDAFSIVMVATTIICLVLTIFAILISCPCLHETISKFDCSHRSEDKRTNHAKVQPVEKEKSVVKISVKELRVIRLKFGAGSPEYKKAANAIGKKDKE